MIAYVDANVIVRFLVGDPPDMVDQVTELMRAVENGDVTLRVDQVTVAEAVWVLRSFYKFGVNQIAATLLTFLSYDGVEVDDVVLSALGLYHDKNVDFIDALLAANILRQGPPVVFSFDKHFDRIPGIERLEPGAQR